MIMPGMKELLAESIEKSISYDAYNELFEKLVQEEKTTGQNQSKDYLHYTKMNLSRTKRVSRKGLVDLALKEKINAVKDPVYILTITEAWCGDASQIVPAVHNLVKENENIDMRVVLRDEHEELMDNFLTNGGKAIPIFIFVSKATGELLGYWGARPNEAQDIVEEYKKMEIKPPYSVLSENLQKWYNKDKGSSTHEEFTNSFLEAMSRTNRISVQ